MSRAGLARLLLVALAVPALACDVRTFPLESRGDAGLEPDAPPPGGGVDAFVVPDVGPGSDVVITLDDGGFPIDEDAAPCSVNLQADPENCGRCDNVCTFANALPLCETGECRWQQCLPGWNDLDRLPATGCEYQCTPTADSTEACDGVDNDCDGVTDEDTQLVTDVNNCGGCKIKCAFLHAAAMCDARMCVLGACAQGFKNANQLAADGCECSETNGGQEVCDGMDNDCNGVVDDVPGIATSNDPQHCGACSANCTALPNAMATCEMGACKIQVCAFGYSDNNTQVGDGCELACPGGFVGAIEVCDNVDNDCDGKIDSADDTLTPVANFCAEKGECSGSAPQCVGGGWRCNYSANVEVVANNTIIGNETRCDGLDNDCDGCIDEAFPQVGLRPAANGGTCGATSPTACADEGKGQCQGIGHFVCNTAGNGVQCTVDVAGQQPVAEACDNIDNNCDGTTDNGLASDPDHVKDAMVLIGGGAVGADVYIDAYEASRPDSAGLTAGVVNRRACSKADALPWVSVTHAEAAVACTAAGKRLCTETEWQRACTTAAATACEWSFGSACTTRSLTTCNVFEFDGDGATAGNQDQSRASGGMAACFADWAAFGKVFDLTGNVREWTAPRAAGVFPLRGGSYDTVLDGSACDFSFLAVDGTFRYKNSGFRCCRDGAP